MNPTDVPHTVFMTDRNNYYYDVILFGLKNAGAIYQILMDKVFVNQIGRNLEVYVDDMVIKTPTSRRHINDLTETFKFMRNFDMRLNPEKFTSGVQAEKFLKFMLTSQEIEANLDKCQGVLDMRSPSSKIEVQQLTGRLVALSRFLSYTGDKAIHFFTAIHKSQRIWVDTCLWGGIPGCEAVPIISTDLDQAQSKFAFGIILGHDRQRNKLGPGSRRRRGGKIGIFCK